MADTPAIPWTIEQLEELGLRGTGAGFKRTFPEMHAHILHKVFNGNATAAADFLEVAQSTVNLWFTSHGLVPTGRDRPRRGEYRDRDQRLTGKEVVALWMQQPLTEYALAYKWDYPKEEELVSLICLSDLHAQSPRFDAPRLLRTLNYIGEDPARRWLCAGDLFTNNTRQSVGSVEEQTVGIWEAVDGMTELLLPVASQCVGIAHGNHDARIKIKSDVDFNPVESLCRNLGVNYLGYMKHIVLNIGRLKYTLYVHHGKGAAASDGGRLNMGMGIMRTVTSDITIVGHLHDEMNKPAIRRGPADAPAKNGKVPVEDHKQHMVMVASFERYGGYAQENGLPPTRLGSCRIEFSTKAPKDWRVLQ